MKNLYFLLCVILITSCTFKKSEKKVSALQKKIKVGVFNRNGDSPFCIIDAYEALRIDSEISPQIVSAADITSGKCDDFDVLLFPGGGGKSETNSLGEKGIEYVQNFVKEKGKGVVGICAGAYILTNTPNYPGLRMSGAKAIDIEHDHRGNGLCKFSLSKEGKKIFPELNKFEIAYTLYYEGPVMEINKNDKVNFVSLATMLSDVHLIEGTPKNMTNNKPYITTSEPGKGRTVSFVGHPESTPGMRWMVPRMVRWAAKKELVSYKNNVVKPEMHTKEILYTKELREEQRELYSKLFGTEQEKLDAITRIKEIKPWSAKKWFNGLTRDESAKVRIEAAKALVFFERTEAIEDIEAAILNEKDKQIKKELTESLKQLKAMVGANK